MKQLKITTTTALCFLLFSCGNSENKTPNEQDINIESVINSKSLDPNAKGDNKCLMEYQNKYDALVSEADVLAATGFSKSNMKTKYNKNLKNPQNHEFVYQFQNGRMGKAPGFKNEITLPDVVVIRSIIPMSLSTFQQSYKEVTDEQKQVADEVIADIAEGNSGNVEADKALKKAKEQNISKEDIKKTGGTLTNAFQEISKGYRKVEGLGDAAVWNVVTSELYVLQNGVKFEIRTDISNDTEKNKMAAIKLAKIILKKCQ